MTRAAAGKIAYHWIEFSSPSEQELKAIYVVNADGGEGSDVGPGLATPYVMNADGSHATW